MTGPSNPGFSSGGYSADAARRKIAEDRTRLELVRRIAGHISCRLPPSVPFDELVQAGSLGLAQALSRYDPSCGVPFDSFAGSRIRGAILDWLRDEDLLPKQTRKEAKAVETARRELTGELGRVPSTEEIAVRTKMDPDHVRMVEAAANDARVVSAEDFAVEGWIDSIPDSNPLSDPMQALASKQAALAMAECIDELSERERLILSLYHEEELTFKEIGLTLDLTEARICQIYGAAKKTVKKRFAAKLDGRAD